MILKKNTSKSCHVGINWKTLACGVLSDEYLCARVSVIYWFLASFCIGQISHQLHKGPYVCSRWFAFSSQTSNSFQILATCKPNLKKTVKMQYVSTASDEKVTVHAQAIVKFKPEQWWETASSQWQIPEFGMGMAVRTSPVSRRIGLGCWHDTCSAVGVAMKSLMMFQNKLSFVVPGNNNVYLQIKLLFTHITISW